MSGPVPSPIAESPAAPASTSQLTSPTPDMAPTFPVPGLEVVKAWSTPTVPSLADAPPSMAPSIAPTAPAGKQLSSLIFHEQQAATTSVAKSDDGSIPQISRMQQTVIGAMAPGRSAQLSAYAGSERAAAPTEASVPGTAAQPSLAESAIVTPAESPSSPAPPRSQQADTEPRQGLLVLDGAQLGRWMVDHLESTVSRPSAMTTGIDPRMNATWPGAPTGA